MNSAPVHKPNYRRTTVACFLGIFTQAISTNLIAILFIPLRELYGLSYIQLGIIVGVNFFVQVSADLSMSLFIDRASFKKMALIPAAFSSVGLLLLGFSPFIFGRNNVFAGILAATVIFAFASGQLEVILSPIVDAMPNENKGPAMSLMHSFYAWGLAATVILTTVAIRIFGNGCWYYIAFFWAAVPVICFTVFMFSPFPERIPIIKRDTPKKLLFHPFYLLALGAIMSGASAEVVMNQWASTYMEKGLGLPKIIGDLLGMCGFALTMGLGRMLYGIIGAKLDLEKILIAGAFGGAACYIIVAFSPFTALSVLACALCGIFVSLLWPGTLVITSERFPTAGTWIFAILAAAGDIGAGFGGWLTGLVTEYSASSPIVGFFKSAYGTNAEQGSMRAALLTLAVFPLLAGACHIFLKRMKRNEAAHPAPNEEA